MARLRAPIHGLPRASSGVPIRRHPRIISTSHRKWIGSRTTLTTGLILALQRPSRRHLRRRTETISVLIQSVPAGLAPPVSRLLARHELDEKRRIECIARENSA